MEKARIYLACFPTGYGNEVIGYALGEDGQGLASHLSTNSSWAKHDMGLTSTWKHDHYQAVYPNGFELIWIDDPSQDEEWLTALELNKSRPTDEHGDELVKETK